MTFTRAALVAAPLCTLGYGVVRLIGRHSGGYGPGRAWEVGHLTSLVGLLLFVPGVLGLGRMLGPVRGRTVVVVGTLVGVAAAVGQFGVDIVAGLRAADRAGMNAITGQFLALPGAHIVFYVVGPQLLYVGLVMLTAMLAVTDKLPWWSPVFVLAGVSLPVVSLDLIPIGALCLLVGLWPAIARPAGPDISQRARNRELVG